MSKHGLTFDALRAANTERLPLFKDAKGRAHHSDVSGDDWSLCDWMTAVTGEVGEAANIIKKLRRGDFTLDDIVEVKGVEMTVREWLAEELADTVCYLDLAAKRSGIDLGDAVVEKFDKISRNQNLPVLLAGSGVKCVTIDYTHCGCEFCRPESDDGA